MAYIYDLTDTWNAGATTFNGIKLNVTDSASAVASKLVTLQTNGTEHFSVTKAGVGYISGNLGVGTASPSAKLHVDGPFIRYGNSASYTNDEFIIQRVAAGMNLSVRQNVAMMLLTNDTERMRIDSSGNVGVGTSSPLTTLHVQSSTSSTMTRVTSELTGSFYYSGYEVTRSGTTGGALMRSFRSAALGGVGWEWLTTVDNAAELAGTYTSRMVLTNSGNLLVGTTNVELAAGYTNIQAQGSSGAIMQVETTSAVQKMAMYVTASAGYVGTRSNHPAIFITNNTERARIDASGNLLVGTTSTSPTNGWVANTNSGSGFYTQIGHPTGTGSGVAYERFMYNATEIGSITQSGTTAVAYNTSSDYRLKDIDGPIINSGPYIDALKPVQGSWKADGSRFIGLLAHEAQEVSETPIATGEKDGEKMQAMDYSAPEIIANLIAELQSVRARLAQLEGTA